MRRVRIIGVTAVLMTALATAVFGQTVSATTGALNGKVVDASGGVLPGVTVTLRAEPAGTVQTTVTDMALLVALLGLVAWLDRVSSERTNCRP